MKRLLIRPGGIGDCILSLPAMQSLRAEYTEVWVARPNVPLMRFADCARAIPDTGLDLIGIAGYDPPRAALGRLSGFDSIVSWYGANRPEFRDAVAGLPFTFLPALPPAGGPMHAADFFLGQEGAQPRVLCPRGAGDYIVIHPFSGSASKNWPLENFRELARRLNTPVCWCAGPDETLESAVRFDDLYDLACWLAGARLFIGNDSGITHLAAAAGAPVVALFGPTDPAVWGPRGEHVRIIATPQPGAAIEALTVTDVLKQIQLWLNR